MMPNALQAVCDWAQWHWTKEVAPDHGFRITFLTNIRRKNAANSIERIAMIGYVFSHLFNCFFEEEEFPYDSKIYPFVFYTNGTIDCWKSAKRDQPHER